MSALRKWKNVGNEESEDENYEKVEINVDDKTDKEIGDKNKETSEIKRPGQKSSVIANFFSIIKNEISDLFFTVYDLALYTQRKVTHFFKISGDKIANVYDNVISKFNQKKATEISEKNQKRFFTAFIFNSREKKMLSEIRFQILDKSDNPIPNLETTLFSDPQISITDDNGIASFKDIPIGSHTLAFDYQNESFQKKVSIEDTLIDEGKVRAEIVQVKAEKGRIAVWMWSVLILLIIAILSATYFARKYYKLLRKTRE
jgi:hypothetical protein